MIFLEAIVMMQHGYKVKRRRWLSYDFIYLKKDILLCDGEFEYEDYLSVKDYNAKDWIVCKEDL